ncbi:MAG TPA: tRNA preQ1(34) S-adenosylmethionine ribosyltransferase-isomerase QueA [Acidobacteriota bacterium]|nr:tRNA preQ1(34) S-adenosylmethionine ribosyltransferase-isomerase QueA [Acidobacteriota bacterium]
MKLRLSDFDYHLPARLIAQHPSQKRDRSRLMVVERQSGDIGHCQFRDLPQLLKPDDLLVLNDSRVIPARLFARRPGGTRPIEILLLKDLGEGRWEALLRPGRRVRAGDRLVVAEGRMEAEVLPSPSNYRRLLKWHCQGDFSQLLQEHGQMPLPPYIQRSPGGLKEDLKRYQTVYAAKPGSVAAPTAGLHFTPALLERLRHVFLTLHVGYGTFRPIQSEDLTAHEMEAEFFEISPQAARAIQAQRNAQGRVVTVGSTSTRVLEHLASSQGEITAGAGETGLFIYPGHEWRVSEALITNFHLPRSTLFVLVSAFAGRELMQRCYRQAVEREYRFYSYGDAMLIV